ncbi:MAG: hypothetical protein R2862_07145 [Thermoanaerobaculia bacterium]
MEVLSSNPAEGTITVREKATGKEITFDLEDIKAGKFSITSDGEETHVDIDASAADGCSLKVTTDGGTATFGAGSRPFRTGSGLSRIAQRRPLDHRIERREVGLVLDQHGGRAGRAALVLRGEAQGGRLRGAARGALRRRRAEWHSSASNAGRTLSITAAAQEGSTQALVTYNEKH